jgi:prepilin-type N-terminal cleavage/methylation domain-containing protein
MSKTLSPITFRGLDVRRPIGQQGFTLIEMSIVLVIIGLIIGGIIKGEEVVANDRMRSQVAQIDAVKGAVFTFQDKYIFMPGDFTASTSLSTASTTDGNQDGIIADHSSTATTSLADNAAVTGGTSEAVGAWIQLAAANLLAGIQTQPVGTSLTTATNAYYAGKTGNSFLWLATFHSGYGATQVMVRLQAGTGTPGPIVRYSDGSSMDSKYDDGVPGTGSIIMSSASTSPGCIAATPASTSPGSYSIGTVTQNTLTCVPLFIIQ